MLARFLKWIGLLLVLPLLVFGGLMLWDAKQLDNAVEQVSASFVFGGSPFIIPLPADRIAMVSVSKQDSRQNCADLAIKNGVVRSAQIAGQSASVAFDRGIDLTAYADALRACDRMNIALMANWGYLKGGFALEYAESRVTHIETIRLWD